MSGRNQFHLRELSLQRVPLQPHQGNDPRHLQTRAVAAHAHLLEDRIALQHREIQTLLLNNQRFAATHVALKQELSLAQEDLHHLSNLAADVKAERDNQVREVYEKSLKLDAELRSIDAMSAELVQVRTDIQKLTVHRQERDAQWKSINGEIVRAKTEAQHVAIVRAEIETVQKEIQRGRAAIELEKKTRAINLEQEQALQRNLLALAREIERLRAELANAEKRARAAAAAAGTANPSPGYAGNYSNPEVGYGGSSCPDPYGAQQVQVGDSSPAFTSRAMSNGPYAPAQR